MNTTKVLVVDPELHVISDFRREAAELGSDAAGGTQDAGNGEVEVTALQSFSSAHEVMSRAYEAGAPFAVAFLDAGTAPEYRGLEMARKFRQQDEDLYVVILSQSRSADFQQRFAALAGGEHVAFLAKPLEAMEIRSWMTGLCARWRANRTASHSARGGGLVETTAVVAELPVAAAVFDRRGALSLANEAMIELYPELAGQFKYGARIEKVEEALFALAGERPVATHAGGLSTYRLRLGQGRQTAVHSMDMPAGETVWFHCPVGALLEEQRALLLHGILSAAAGETADGPQVEARLPADEPVEARGKVVTLERKANMNPAPAEVGTRLHRSVPLQRAVLPDLRRTIANKIDDLGEGSQPVLEPEFDCCGRIWSVEIPAGEFGAIVEELCRLRRQRHDAQDRFAIGIENVVVDPAFSQRRPGLTAGEYVRVTFHGVLPPGEFPASAAGREMDLLAREFPLQVCRCLPELSLASAFATAAEGYMEVDLEEDGGAAVSFYLPRERRAGRIGDAPPSRKRTGALQH